MKKPISNKILRIRANNDLAFYRAGLISKKELEEKTNTYREKFQISFTSFLSSYALQENKPL